MKTISFYSYKGGVGRSLALAYTAKYLADRGQRVCILDMDLEAPGVAYKFPEKSDDVFSKPGVVDYINAWKGGKKPEDISEYFSTVREEENGYIKIMGAGEGGIKSKEYWTKLFNIDWKILFSGDFEGVDIFTELIDQIEEQINPDYLLIDSRSGVTIMGQVCNAVLPDTVVMLLANNRENCYGFELMYNYMLSSEGLNVNQKQPDIFCAITRYPTIDDMFGKRRLLTSERAIIDRFIDFVGNPPNLEINKVSIIASDKEVERDELSVLRESQGTEEKLIEQDYRELIRKIVGKEVPTLGVEEVRESREKPMISIGHSEEFEPVFLRNRYYFDSECVFVQDSLPVKYKWIDEYFQFEIRKAGNKTFLSDQGKTLKMLDKAFKLDEPDVEKNLRAILREFQVLESGADFSVEIRDTNPESEEEAKWRLFRCVSFMNYMKIFYRDIQGTDEDKITKSDNPSTDIDLQQRYPFPIKYQRTGDGYEFAVIEKDGKFFLSDQGRTYEMLDMVFELKEPDVQKNLHAIMKECGVSWSDNKFLIELHSREDNAELEEAKYKLLECVSFMDTMRIFYI